MNSPAAARAAQSRGTSDPKIHARVAEVIRSTNGHPGTLVDMGCGTSSLARILHGAFQCYVGCDLVAYECFPTETWARFVQANLDEPPYPIADSSADVIVAIETIEHLENPRLFVRELARIAKPQGLVIITTPNQLSVLSKLTLVFKNQFNAFQRHVLPGSHDCSSRK